MASAPATFGASTSDRPPPHVSVRVLLVNFRVGHALPFPQKNQDILPVRKAFKVGRVAYPRFNKVYAPLPIHLAVLGHWLIETTGCFGRGF